MANSSEREKKRPTFNPWNDAQILTHVTSNVDRASDIVRMRIVNATVIPSRTYNRSFADVRSENYFHSADKAALDYLKDGNTLPSYSVNTVHLQNPYRPPQRLEGFASRDHAKVRLTFTHLRNRITTSVDERIRNWTSQWTNKHDLILYLIVILKNDILMKSVWELDVKNIN